MKGLLAHGKNRIAQTCFLGLRLIVGRGGTSRGPQSRGSALPDHRDSLVRSE